MNRRVTFGIVFFACIFIIALSINLNTASAAEVTLNGVKYDENDYTKIKYFLNLNSSEWGKTNGQALNAEYDADDPVTWTGVTWTDTEVKRVESISWSSKPLGGYLYLSEAASLTSLICDGNDITGLDVRSCPVLTELKCNYNLITDLKVSGCTALQTLYCQDNRLTVLDVDENEQLLELYCYSNQLSELNVGDNKQLTDLLCYSNQLTALNLENNTALKKLDCSENNLTSLDLSKNLQLNYLACYQIR